MADVNGVETKGSDLGGDADSRRFPRKSTPRRLSRCELVIPGLRPRPARFVNWSPSGALLSLAEERASLEGVEIGRSVEIRCQDFPGRFRGRICRLDSKHFAVAFEHGVEAYLSSRSPS